jgi:hypothetical protein
VRSDSFPGRDAVGIPGTPSCVIRHAAGWTAVAAMMVSVMGCSKSPDPWNRAAAQGNVTLDGAPLKEGTITFFPSGATKGPAAGGEIRDGRYEIPADGGPVVGTNRIEIRSVQKTGRIVKSPMAVESSGPPIDMVEELKEVVPPEYNRNSKLEFTILEAGENVNDVAIESAPKKRPDRK